MAKTKKTTNGLSSSQYKFMEHDFMDPAFKGWILTSGTTITGNVSVASDFNLAELPNFGWEHSGCPSCSGATELKAFSSFSYTYCPTCKEDVEVLRKRK